MAALATFDLPASRLADAQKRVNRFARKASKLVQAAPSLTVVCEFERRWVVSSKGALVAGPFDGFAPLRDDVDVQVLPMVRVEVAGERPVVKGWEFAATIERVTAEDGSTLNLLNTSPAYVGELPIEYRTRGPELCDHCKTRRQRNSTFIVRNTATCSHLCVGRNCLADFLASTEAAAWMAVFELEKAARELSEWDDGDGGFGYSSPLVTVGRFLAGVIAVARELGYVSSAQAYGGNSSTGGLVFSQLGSRKAAEREAINRAISDSDVSKAGEALAWLADVDASGDNDYMHNLRVCAALGVVTGKTCRRLASLIPSFSRELAQRKEQAERVNEHLAAEIGTRPVLDVVVGKISSFENDYGWTYFVRLRSSCGRALVWRTSNPVDAEGVLVEEGDSFRAVGRVEERCEYQGKLETRLSRVALHAEGSEDKKLASAARKFAKAHSVDAPAWAWTAAQKKRAKVA